ncbi:WYL domain-containing protein [Clostridium sp. AF19-22AC]|jgi:predicted DNA-binding transcriptional regulator YafY|uniref:WYL domain-containing protein n=1 Tax=Faecalicatena orotica TaxID=1544 RepID=A0A2Y9BPJ0_9FIRM|nr:MULTISPECIES: WYL domain-containing protein [Clostridia]PWJ21464.1 WYL domain-containing protein [Faecalicatena orotica]RHR28093.1 WYL domain-containing protein [Clostridium sp. AF19-22AC]SSA58439.1 WYL domain-containing protein [Faecalicatena orotica]
MATRETKLKLLYLMKILLEQTDEDHVLSTIELINELKRYGISAERKSIYDDIEALNEFGMDIINKRTQPSGFYVAGREFELPELKLLVDAVQASKFITENKTNELIKKLENLTSKFEARQNGEFYIVSPWALTWDDENYYMIAYDSAVKSVKYYRVDKMINTEMTKERRAGRKEFARFDLAAFAKKTFGMYGGEERSLKLRFGNELIGVVIDRFGKGILIHMDDADHFIAHPAVNVSRQFFGWISSLGDRAEILGPDDVVEMYVEWLKSLLKCYHMK